MGRNQLKEMYQRGIMHGYQMGAFGAGQNLNPDFIMPRAGDIVVSPSMCSLYGIDTEDPGSVGLDDIFSLSPDHDLKFHQDNNQALFEMGLDAYQDDNLIVFSGGQFIQSTIHVRRHDTDVIQKACYISKIAFDPLGCPIRVSGYIQALE